MHADWYVRRGVKVVIIDYLQLMTASGLKNNANREQEVRSGVAVAEATG